MKKSHMAIGIFLLIIGTLFLGAFVWSILFSSSEATILHLSIIGWLGAIAFFLIFIGLFILLYDSLKKNPLSRDS